MSENACYRWVFTLNQQDHFTLDDIFREKFIRTLREHSKKWKFQKEVGEESLLPHYQGRLALFKKLRHADVCRLIRPELNIFWRPEHDEKKSDEYCSKEDGRVDGPWSSDDKQCYVPRKVREMVLQGWQCNLKDKLVRDVERGDDRTVHVVVDKDGGIGKSTFCRYMSCKMRAIVLPGTIDTADNLMKLACTSIGKRKEGIILLLDLPRSIGKNVAQWEKWITTLEQLKGGHLTDWRYQGHNDWCEPIAICVFTNTEPPGDCLSARRLVTHRPMAYNSIFGARAASPVRAGPDVVDLSNESDSD